MKNVLILHGTDAHPDANWFPWLKDELEMRGCKVWAPLLPDNNAPNKDTYGDFLFSTDWQYENSILVGHSSGAVEVLNLLMDERMPKVDLAVLVGAWSGGAPEGMSFEPFKNLFPVDGFDYDAIKNKAKKIVFIHGDDDPYCPLDQARYLSEKLEAELVVIPNGGHLGADIKELPQVLQAIHSNNN